MSALDRMAAKRKQEQSFDQPIWTTQEIDKILDTPRQHSVFKDMVIFLSEHLNKRSERWARACFDALRKRILERYKPKEIDLLEGI